MGLRPRAFSMGWFRHSSTGSVLYAMGKETQVPAVIIPIPETSMACTSEAGSATLCGFSEYTLPSLPPRKYLVKSVSGNVGLSFSGNGNTTCDHPGRCIWQDTWSGQITYNPSDCTSSGTLIETRVMFQGPCAQGSLPFQSVTAYSTEEPGVFSFLMTQTTITPVSVAPCVITPANNSSYGLVASPNIVEVLSSEDTEAAAMARATGTTTGTSCTAEVQGRGAGEFSFAFVAVLMNFSCSNLLDGQNYRLHWITSTEDYGGGSPVAGSDSFDFVASGTAQIVPVLLNCPSGKQVTASVPTITVL